MDDLFPEKYIPIGTTSISLIERVRRGDDNAAWERLASLYGRLILYWCKQRNVPRSDRNDLFQETMQTVAKYIHRFEKQQGSRKHSFRSWLRTIVESRISDYYRERKAVPAPISDSQLVRKVEQSTQNDDEKQSQHERQLLIGQALKIVQSETDPKIWEMFYQTAVLGFNSTEIAELLGTTPANVRQAKRRVLMKIREEFQGLID